MPSLPICHSTGTMKRYPSFGKVSMNRGCSAESSSAWRSFLTAVFTPRSKSTKVSCGQRALAQFLARDDLTGLAVAIRSCRVPKNRSGHHGHANKVGVLDVVRQMASQYADEQIAATLNRLGLRTGRNNTWNKQRVRDLRSELQLPVFDEARADRTMLTMEQAAARLHTSTAMIKRLIEAKVIAATQVVPCAPWQISEEAVKSQVVMDAVKMITGRRSRIVPQSQDPNPNQLTFSMP